MTTLRVYGLGQLRVYFDQVPVRFPTKKTQDLLCFLLLHDGKAMERELIAEQLWPQRLPEKARRCLSTTLWRLRQTLERQPATDQPYLLTAPATLAFNATAPYWFDVEAFEQQASLGLAGPLPCTDACRHALEEALALYQGDLLEGYCDDWCLAERERLQLLLLRVLKMLQRHCRLCGAFETATSYGRRLLALDSLQEDVHRELMRCYVASGQRPLALEQFQRCRETLRQELQIEPMLETWRLYRRIRSGGSTVPSPGDSENGLASLSVVLNQVRHALDTLESVWHALQVVTAELGEASEPAETGTPYPERG